MSKLVISITYSSVNSNKWFILCINISLSNISCLSNSEVDWARCSVAKTKSIEIHFYSEAVLCGEGVQEGVSVIHHSLIFIVGAGNVATSVSTPQPQCRTEWIHSPDSRQPRKPRQRSASGLQSSSCPHWCDWGAQTFEFNTPQFHFSQDADMHRGPAAGPAHAAGVEVLTGMSSSSLRTSKHTRLTVAMESCRRMLKLILSSSDNQHLLPSRCLYLPSNFDSSTFYIFCVGCRLEG